MKSKIISKSTTNRGEFNRAYKVYLEKKARIHCSRCSYNRGENDTRKCYGGYAEDGGIKFPNWKLVSKNEKQWMPKTLKITRDSRYGNREYTTIKW